MLSFRILPGLPRAAHSPAHVAPGHRRIGLAACCAAALALLLPQASPAQTPATEPAAAVQGPIQLRQPGSRALSAAAPAAAPAAGDGAGSVVAMAPDEFEVYARRLAGQASSGPGLRRFGSELITGPAGFDVPDGNALVPNDYVLAPGDEVLLTLWGSVEADLRLPVDRSGRIAIPRVGTVTVAGVRYGDLQDTISKRVAQVFRNFQISVALGQLRSVRIYVTGFAQRPGSYLVSSLSTIVGAVMRAGGPAAAGSFRNIQLKRGRETVSQFDLYDLLLKGDKAADRVVQAEDVIHIGPVGLQVAVIGSVNRPAVFEIRPADTIAEVLRMAGDFSPVADRSRLSIERLDERNEARITQLTYPSAARDTLQNGDVVRAFSAVDATLPVARQNKRVRIEGEVARPGEYVVPASTTVQNVLQLAGGYTDNAFVFGTEFNRESVRATQQENYERALRDLETEFTRANATQRTSNADDAASVAVRNSGIDRLITRLRAIKPTGRIVLQLQPDARELPDLALEDGDRIYIPPRPTTVGVFGSVFNGGSYLHAAGRNVGDYLKQAGGPTRGADAKSTFVVRANGSVVSSPQQSGLFGRSTLAAVRSEPGDTVFVPEEMDKSTWVQALRDWTQIFYQFGLGAAAIKTLGN